MQSVEKTFKDDPMRIGIGPEQHHEVLRRALKCEKLLTIEQVDGMMVLEIDSPVRDIDTAIFIRPNILTPAHYKWLAIEKGLFEVPGHEPRRLITWDDRQEFRALRPTVPEAQVPETRGAPKEYEIPDDYHTTAVKLWHHGEMRDGKWKATYKPAEIVEKIKEDTGVEVSKFWARDRAFEAVGHYKRNPATV